LASYTGKRERTEGEETTAATEAAELQREFALALMNTFPHVPSDKARDTFELAREVFCNQSNLQVKQGVTDVDECLTTQSACSGTRCIKLDTHRVMWWPNANAAPSHLADLIYVADQEGFDDSGFAEQESHLQCKPSAKRARTEDKPVLSSAEITKRAVLAYLKTLPHVSSGKACYTFELVQKLFRDQDHLAMEEGMIEPDLDSGNRYFIERDTRRIMWRPNADAAFKPLADMTLVKSCTDTDGDEHGFKKLTSSLKFIEH
jgi:hypothetical protein